MKVVISGSFRKHLQGILKLKKELEERGIEVIKPNRVKTINNIDNPDFVKFEGEENIDPWTLESEYFDAIEKCDAHIIYNQDSYLGTSTAIELGASLNKGENTKVYLLEKSDQDKMIAQKENIDEEEKQDIREFCELLEDMERHGILGIGIDQLYKDFNIVKQVTDKDMDDVKKLSTEEKSISVMKDYNDIASEYCDEFCETEVYNSFIDKWLQTMQKGNILDVGCGDGNNCEYINERDGFQAYGIDFSDGMIAEARKRYPNIKIKKMDMTNITFPDQIFDGILSNCSLIHIPTELLSQTLQGFKRILKPKGKLLLIVLEGEGEEMAEEPYRQGQNIYAYTKYFTVEEVSKILNDNGFKVDEIEKRQTESENELAGGKLVIYASNERIKEQKWENFKNNEIEIE